MNVAEALLPKAGGAAGEAEADCGGAYIKKLMMSQTHH